ncbi:MAG: putative beta-lysine N-acetyltransferase [Cytophagales bacterium]|nr:putative beta-lysine N-acetyltransferase [Cytophagales bacterium]
MMFDKVETISKSLIQHGPNNDRVYLMKLHHQERVDQLIDQLFNLAILKRYSKIFAKVPGSALPLFLENNFKMEAAVPGLYPGEEQGYFLGKYFNAKRGYLSKQERKLFNEVKESALNADKKLDNHLPDSFDIRKLDAQDLPKLARVYKQVFQFYPFPIFDEFYLLDNLKNDVQYFGVYSGDELVAASAAEMDKKGRNVEMTDFATCTKYRGKNLSYFLLRYMENQMMAEGMQTAYTIARSVSYGMNKTFARLGFYFGGTLVNNTLIGEEIESMNVWYKSF